MKAEGTRSVEVFDWGDQLKMVRRELKHVVRSTTNRFVVVFLICLSFS